MTETEIIEAARECGFVATKYDTAPFLTFGATATEIQRFAKLIEQRTLERAAVYFERKRGMEMFCENIADELRALKEK